MAGARGLERPHHAPALGDDERAVTGIGERYGYLQAPELGPARAHARDHLQDCEAAFHPISSCVAAEVGRHLAAYV